MVPLVALLLALSACSTTALRDPVVSPAEEAVGERETEQVPGCRPGKPVKIGGDIRIPESCPTSRPAAVGFSQPISLGSVLAPLPCTELPDFAGSYWRVVGPYPADLAKVGHDDIPGKITLASRNEALFSAKATHMSMGSSTRTMRFPAQGRLTLSFKRLEGAVAIGGCD